jgi:hypothetical protein
MPLVNAFARRCRVYLADAHHQFVEPDRHASLSELATGPVNSKSSLTGTSLKSRRCSATRGGRGALPQLCPSAISFDDLRLHVV